MLSHPGDRQTLNAMTAHGADLSKPTEVNFYLYLPTRAAAEAAVEEVRRSGYVAEVRPPLPGYDTWLCFAIRDMLTSPEAIDLARVGFEALAQRFNGEFDGWEAAIAL